MKAQCLVRLELQRTAHLPAAHDPRVPDLPPGCGHGHTGPAHRRATGTQVQEEQRLASAERSEDRERSLPLSRRTCPSGVELGRVWGATSGPGPRCRTSQAWRVEPVGGPAGCSASLAVSVSQLRGPGASVVDKSSSTALSSALDPQKARPSCMIASGTGCLSSPCSLMPSCRAPHNGWDGGALLRGSSWECSHARGLGDASAPG